MTTAEIREAETVSLAKYQAMLHEQAEAMTFEASRIQDKIKQFMDLAEEIQVELACRPRPDCQHIDFTELPGRSQCDDCGFSADTLSDGEGCMCGNTAELEGFRACDETGRITDETGDEWCGLSRCMRCNAFYIMEAA